MFVFKIRTHHANGGRTTLQEIIINVSLHNHQSPVVVALHKLEETARLNRKQKTHTHRLKGIVEYLSLSLHEALNVPLSDHTRESFDDLLYTVEQSIGKRQKSSFTKLAEWEGMTRLLKLNHQPMSDGTHVSACLKNYSSTFKGNQLSQKKALQKLTVIPHTDFKDLEKKATLATEEILDTLLKACGKDIDEYLRVCAKQTNFTRYKLKDAAKVDMHFFLKNFSTNKTKDFSQPDILKAFLVLMDEEPTFKFRAFAFSDLNFPSAKKLSLLKGFSHYLYSNACSQPWWFCRFRLPNYVLTSCYLLLLAKTGWNISSVGSLALQDIRKLPNGTYELQARKHKTQDDTPKFIVSKADKYLKICLSLLIWNHAQLVKYNVITSSEENVWYGWQKSYDKPFFPLDPGRLVTFFSRHQIPAIPPSEIRPVNSAYNFLKYNDLEMVRVLLGHSSLETTKSYIENNLIFQLNEARILEFQRRMENTIAYETTSVEKFEARGFCEKNVHPTLIGRRPTGETEMETRLLNEAKAFLTSIGIKFINEGSVVTIETLTQAILLRNYYRLRWSQLFDKNPEFFAIHHINIMLYIHAFLRIASERKPLLVQSVLKEIGGMSNA